MNRPDRVATFEEVQPFSEADQPCFDEIRQVLAKHGALNRFGICLLHSHFPMADDEMLVELVNTEARKMVLTPMKHSEIGPALETAWQFADDQQLIGPGPIPGPIPGPGPTKPVPTQKCIKGCTWSTDENGKKTHLETHKLGG